MNTDAWAKTLDISNEETAPTVPDYEEACARTAAEVASRTLVLQGVIAVACEVEPKPILGWFREQGLWDAVTPQEKAFFDMPSQSEQECIAFRWHWEAQWTLLWTIGYVDHLGLPTRCCDTAKIVDEIIPPLGSDIGDFVSSAKLRAPGALLAEDDRTYNLWCYAQSARREGTLPDDLNWSVLYERRYAFEWLDGTEDWDDVTCDA